MSRGEAIFGPAVAGRLLQFFAALPQSAAVPFPELTVREREILDLMAGGLSNAEIARKLNLSSKTIDSYREHLKLKLNLDSGAELVRQAQAKTRRPW